MKVSTLIKILQDCDQSADVKIVISQIIETSVLAVINQEDDEVKEIDLE